MISKLKVRTNADQEALRGRCDSEQHAVATDPLSVTIQPRPDLQVVEVLCPTRWISGGTLSVEFVVPISASVATTTPTWTDRVYLSLDGSITRDDILIAELANQSAFEPGESYRSSTASITVPLRYRGDMFVLVATDVDHDVDEWPGETNNLVIQPIYVDPVPFADLVVSDVVAPVQAVGGAEIEVRYTVTNLGSGATNADAWTEMVWLTRDRNRPHPGQQHGDHSAGHVAA